MRRVPRSPFLRPLASTSEVCVPASEGDRRTERQTWEPVWQPRRRAFCGVPGPLLRQDRPGRWAMPSPSRRRPLLSRAAPPPLFARERAKGGAAGHGTLLEAPAPEPSVALGLQRPSAHALRCQRGCDTHRVQCDYACFMPSVVPPAGPPRPECAGASCGVQGRGNAIRRVAARRSVSWAQNAERRGLCRTAAAEPRAGLRLLNCGGAGRRARVAP